MFIIPAAITLVLGLTGRMENKRAFNKLTEQILRRLQTGTLALQPGPDLYPLVCRFEFDPEPLRGPGCTTTT